MIVGPLDDAARARDSLRGLRVVLAGPAAPPAGGMTVQAEMLARHLAAEGATVVRVPSNPPVGPIGAVPKIGGMLRLLAYRRRLRAAIAEGADVLHLQSCSWAYFWRITAFALREARDADVTTVLRWDGGEADSFFARRPDAIREVMQLADHIVVPSGYLEEVFERRLGLATEVVSNLVEAPQLARARVAADGPLRLLCSRHLSREYGVDVVLDAAARAVAAGADLRLTVAGDGRDAANLRRTGRQLLGDRVRFVGRVPRETVLETLENTDAVVNGSWFDNFPVALAESLAAGVPVATTDAGGIPWMVEHGRTGLVTPTGDAEALAASLCTLHADRDLGGRLGREGRVAAARWTWGALRGRWSDIYATRTPSDESSRDVGGR